MSRTAPAAVPTGAAVAPRALLRRALLLLALLAGPGAARTLAAGDPQVRPGHWNKDKIPKGWVVLDTEHYQVQSEVGPEKAKLLADHLESVNACYQAFLPSKRRTETFVLKVFRSRKDFQVYSNLKPDDGTVAYYKQDTRELVGYDSGVILGKRDIPAAIALAPGCKLKLGDADKARLQERSRRSPTPTPSTRRACCRTRAGTSTSTTTRCRW